MLDRSTGQSLASQLEKEFRRRIDSGEWPVNGVIPSEAALCEEFGVSRTTVRWAIQQLVGDNLLYRVRGKGTIVKLPALVSHVIASGGIRTKIWEMLKLCNPIKVLLEYRKPSVGTARKLGLGEDEQVICIERQYQETESGMMHSIIYTYLPASNAGAINIDMLYTTQIGEQLEAMGIVSASITERLTVSGTNAHESRCFGLPENSPVMVLEEIRMDNERLPFYLSKYITRGDMVEICFSETET